MRILILNWRDTKHPKAGGAEIVTHEHAKAWVKAGHTVTWFTAHFRGSPKREVIDGVNVVRQAGSLTVYLAAPVFYALHKHEFDLVVDEIHGVPFFTPLYVRKPKIAFIHEVADEIWDYMWFFPINKLGKALERLYFRFYRNVSFWTDAPSTIIHLERFGIPGSHCIAIACPITNPVLANKPQKEKNPTFIFVSRVVKMKGIEEVIKAFSFIVKEEARVRLWILGGGESEYVEMLKDMLRDYNIEHNVIFFGKVSEEEKLERMRHAHLLLHASVREGWGLVVLEAASQWTPSVVYNVSGLCDVVKNGRTGVVLRHNSPREMAQAALSLVADDKRYVNYQRAGLRWVKSLSWKEATEQSLELLTKAVKHNAH